MQRNSVTDLSDELVRVLSCRRVVRVIGISQLHDFREPARCHSAAHPLETNLVNGPYHIHSRVIQRPWNVVRESEIEY